LRITAGLSLSIPCTTISAGFTKLLRVTPAMEAGIADHVWTIEEVVALIDSANTAKIVLGEAA
jgi:hypothetical protein